LHILCQEKQNQGAFIKIFSPSKEREVLQVKLSLHYKQNFHKLHFAQADQQQVYWLINQTARTKFVPECI